MYAHYDSAPGWYCQAQIKKIAGEIGVSKYNEFAWAYAYSNSISISLSWNGNDFSIPMGAIGSNGHQTHRR